MDFPINLIIPDLRPSQFTIRSIANELAQNIVGTVDEVLLDSETYVPSETIRSGNITLQSSPSANRLQRIQEKDGTIALLDDAYGIRDTVILPEGLVSVDWRVSDSFLCMLSGSRQSAFYMFHQKDNMKIDLLLVNNGTNQTVGAWDPLIKWPAATPPTMPAATVGSSSLLWVTIRDINNLLYGESVSYSGGAALGGHGGGGLGSPPIGS